MAKRDKKEKDLTLNQEKKWKDKKQRRNMRKDARGRAWQVA